MDVDGSILSEEEAIRLLDQIGPVDIVTGEPLPVFDRLAVAEQKASQRSVNLSMELKGAGEPRSADPEAEILAIYGNDRISGGVTATYDRTKRLLPDEFIAFGAPSDIRFGPRGVVPRGYDVSYSSGRHTFSGNVTPRQEGASRDAPGGRSVYNLGYTYSTPEATYSLQATPFGVRENPDPKTGAAKMVRPRWGCLICFMRAIRRTR